MTWQIPEVFRDQYLAACHRAATNDEAFAKFREDPHISCVIENTPKDWADKALAKMGYTPTMVRYWYTQHLLRQLFGPRGWTEIVEIGGGYGGMCKVLSIAYDLEVYRIYDLPEPLSLQRRFLMGNSPAPTLISDINYPIGSRQFDLCLSWCAWSELSLDLRKEYAEKVISKCDHIFFCCNYNLQEDIEILKQYFPNLKTYEDELVQGVVYA